MAPRVSLILILMSGKVGVVYTAREVPPPRTVSISLLNLARRQGEVSAATRRARPFSTPAKIQIALMYAKAMGDVMRCDPPRDANSSFRLSRKSWLLSFFLYFFFRFEPLAHYGAVHVDFYRWAWTAKSAVFRAVYTDSHRSFHTFKRDVFQNFKVSRKFNYPRTRQTCRKISKNFELQAEIPKRRETGRKPQRKVPSHYFLIAASQ